MKDIIANLITLLVCLNAVTGENLRHQAHQTRELRTSVMCLDLGKRRGLHDMKVSKKKYYNKFIDSVWADGGRCDVPTKKLKNRLSHPHGKLQLATASSYHESWSYD